MAVSDFKDDIICARQRGASYQAIATRFNCSKQLIGSLLKKWDAKEILVPTKTDRGRQALQLLVTGQESVIGKAASLSGVSSTVVMRVARDEGVDLVAIARQHRDQKADSERPDLFNGKQFNALRVVDGTCFRGEKNRLFVDAICAVCGTRKTFRVANLKGGYTKTCSMSCGRRYGS